MDSEATEDTGWIKVGKGKSKGQAPKHLDNLDPPAKGFTVETLQQDFKAKMKTWRASACRQETLSILDKQQPDQGWQLTEAVCLATNSFSRDNWQARYRSMTQFVAFYDVVQALQAKQDGDIVIYAQEPNYTSIDEEFLQTMDIQVLRAGPQSGSRQLGLGDASKHIVPAAFIFEAFMDLDLESMHQLFLGDPALYIGSSVRRWLDLRQSPVAKSQVNSIERPAPETDGTASVQKMTQFNRAVRFAASRRSYRFPLYQENPNVFEGLAVYWKAPKEDIVEHAMS